MNNITQLKQLIISGSTHTNVLDLVQNMNPSEINSKNSVGKTPLHMISEKIPSDNNTNIAKYLVDAGADLDLVDTSGYNALHYACINSNYPLVKLLIDASANVTCRDRYNRTALNIISIKQPSETTNGIIDALVNTNSTNITEVLDKCNNTYLQTIFSTMQNRIKRAR